jgi:hypothetical protein
MEDPDQTGAAEQAFGEATCATTSADATLTGSGSWTSPTTYRPNGTICYKSAIVDINNVNIPARLVGDTVFSGAIHIDWNDTVPTTEAACNALMMEVYEFQKQSGQWVAMNPNNPYVRPGAWFPAGTDLLNPSAHCGTPQLIQYEGSGWSNGGSYRYVVTARTYWSGGPTQSFKFQTVAP